MSSIGGYWEYINSIDFLAHQAISSNNRTMITTIYYEKDASLDDIDESVTDLIKVHLLILTYSLTYSLTHSLILVI